MTPDGNRNGCAMKTEDSRPSRLNQCVLFDWGDTVMRVFPEYSGAMESWPRVETVRGVENAISTIRQHALVCLATNAVDSSEQAIWKALARVGLEDCFDRVFCYENVRFRKPSKEFFMSILNQLGLTGAEVFMVGDDFEGDVLGASASGIGAVWLNTHSTECRAGDRCATIHSLESLPDVLKDLGLQYDAG